jgi:hypothetical protein
LHRLITVAAAIIQRELGELSPSLLSAVESKLKTLFALS